MKNLTMTTSSFDVRFNSGQVKHIDITRKRIGLFGLRRQAGTYEVMVSFVENTLDKQVIHGHTFSHRVRQKLVSDIKSRGELETFLKMYRSKKTIITVEEG
jgi:cephalosporin-C deacetylase-like acetyl esterase